MRTWITARLPLIALLLLLGALPAYVSAGVDYCQNDPILMVGPAKVTILVGVDNSRLQDVTGPIQVVVTVPKGAPTQVIFVSQWPLAEVVSVVESAKDVYNPIGTNSVSTKVYVPGRGGSIPIQTQIFSTHGKSIVVYGASNTWLKATAKLNLK
jgi:hypothetical protein